MNPATARAPIRRAEVIMEPAGAGPLNAEQKIVQGQLSEAVNQINVAAGTLLKGTPTTVEAQEAIARSLVAIARVLIISKAVDFNLAGRLPAL